MPPLAYLLTWTTYGSWLHGDERGWVQSGQPAIQTPDPQRRDSVRGRMIEQAVILNDSQCLLVEKTIREVCQFRNWTLHAVNVRSNHIHVVVSAEAPPDQVLSQLKAWCSRRLSEQAGLLAKEGAQNGKKRWWSEHGSTKWVNDDNYLQNAIHYVNERQ